MDKLEQWKSMAKEVKQLEATLADTRAHRDELEQKCDRLSDMLEQKRKAANTFLKEIIKEL